ncbi:hypothetical protein PMAYCL1PPCAC_19976, partial [Pristionchus mayeri]
GAGIVVITLPMYIIVIALLLSSITGQTGGTSLSFYRIYLIGGVVDMASLLNNHLLCILPAHGYYLDFYLSSIFIGQTYIAIAWGIRCAQVTTGTILALNRLTAVVFPTKFSQLWSSRNCMVANIVQLVPAICMGSFIYTSTFEYEVTWQGGKSCEFEDPEFERMYFSIASTIHTIFVFYIVINYGLVFRSFRKQIKQVLQLRNSSSIEKRRQENRLLYISIVIFVLE